MSLRGRQSVFLEKSVSLSYFYHLTIFSLLKIFLWATLCVDT